MSLIGDAANAYNARDYPRAEQLYTEILRAEPENRQAMLARAVSIARQKGRRIEAMSAFRAFLTLEPDSRVALNWLSKLLRETGRISEALTLAEKAAKQGPGDPDITYNLGLCYLGVRRFEEAIRWLEISIAAAPKMGASYYALACVYEAIGQPWQALLAMKSNVAIDPYPPGFLKLGQLYLAIGDLAHAEEFGLKALAGGPTEQVHLLLADVFADSRPDDSKSHYEAAISLDPKLADQFANGRAKRLSRLGRLEEARAINLRQVELHPSSGVAYLNLCTIQKVTEEDRALVDAMRSAVGQVDQSEEAFLHFALGKSLDDLGEYGVAVEHYDQANALLLVGRPQFDRDRFSKRIDGQIGLFSKEFLARNQLNEEGSGRPIFIVGMMRSGTTLMEQILSNHSKVAAGGELAHWAYSERKVVDLEGHRLRQSALRECRAEYLRILREIDAVSDYVTDKNPANCFSLGTIVAAFPGAHIVYMVRDPVDTALSIYMTPTRHPPEFGGDRESIAYAIRETGRLMEHWERLLPIHRVRYEDVVGDLEGTTRRLAEDLGLEWEESMLHPETNSAIAATPSLFQVRQGVAGAVSRKERYRPWLREFEGLA